MPLWCEYTAYIHILIQLAENHIFHLVHSYREITICTFTENKQIKISNVKGEKRDMTHHGNFSPGYYFAALDWFKQSFVLLHSQRVVASHNSQVFEVHFCSALCCICWICPYFLKTATQFSPVDFLVSCPAFCIYPRIAQNVSKSWSILTVILIAGSTCSRSMKESS